MGDIKWIKITTDIFDDEKILLIESMPDSNAIIVIWFKLLCLAGKQNNSGVFMIHDKIAYTDEMLATIFRMNLNTVRLALDTFENFGMIDRIQGVITIPNWGKHQSADKIEKYNEYHKNYQREYRKKQKAKALGETQTYLLEDNDDDVNRKVNGEVNRKVNVNCVDKELDIEQEQEKDNKNNKSQTIEKIREAWNSLQPYGISPIRQITTGSTRYKMVNARVSEYSLDEVLEAIECIKESDFLLGRKTDFVITFDWFIKPNNFPKVLDRNYSGAKNQQKGRLDFIDNVDYTGI